MAVKILYVLGSTRSGTSALRNAICTTRYKGYGEGHLTPLLSDIIKNIRQHRTNGLGVKVPGNGLYAMKESVFLRHIFWGYERYLSSEFGVTTIVDKTPTITPISLAPELNKFHEDAVFIHCSRRHVDNVLSKMKKFPERTMLDHCREWAECNSAWLEARDRLGGNFLEFDFYELVTNPEGVAAKISSYLELSSEEESSIASYLTSQRPESDSTKELTNFARLSDVEWSSKDREMFVQICGPIGQKLSYGLESYFDDTKVVG